MAILNFIVNHKEVVETDIPSMFGDFDGNIADFDEIVLSEATTLEELAVTAKIFLSKGQARKNKLFGPIPHGLSWFGTKKKRFWVWNPVLTDEEIVVSPNFDHTEKWFSFWNPEWKCDGS